MKSCRRGPSDVITRPSLPIRAHFGGTGDSTSGSILSTWANRPQAGWTPHQVHRLPKNRPIVCVCGSEYRSGIAASVLAQIGLSSVACMGGGMGAWNKRKLSVETSAWSRPQRDSGSTARFSLSSRRGRTLGLRVKPGTSKSGANSFCGLRACHPQGLIRLQVLLALKNDDCTAWGTADSMCNRLVAQFDPCRTPASEGIELKLLDN